MPLKDLEARRKYHREYMQRYFSDPERYRKHLVRVGVNNTRNRTKARKLVAAFKAFGCSACPEKDACCLDAHHLGDKDINIHEAIERAWSPKRVAAELAKCVCLCANCHRKVHAGKLILSTSGGKADALA